MRRIYEFGEYQLDVSAFELRRAGVRVDVQPKVLRLLSHLIECRERAVSGEELMRLLWPEEIVGDGSLKRAVCGARQAIGERGGRDGRIRTVHRFGYQFVGSLRETASPSNAVQAAVHAHNAGARGDLRDLALGAAVGDSELLELLQRALICASTESSPSCILINSRAAGAGRTLLLDRFMAIARPLGVGAYIARCAARVGVREEDALAQLVLQAANERGPILVGLDDIHHASAHALRRLRMQLQAVKSVRILLIATCRSIGSGPEVEALSAKLPTFRISLCGLSPADLHHYVVLAIGRPPSDRLVNTLHNLSAGNPLFLRLLLGIWRTEGRKTWTQIVRPLLERQGANAVFELIAQYLTLLPVHAVRILRIAALLGASFSAERLATLSLMRPDQQAESLGRVRAAGLIVQDGTDRDVYRFVHAAVRAAVQGQPSAASSQRSWSTQRPRSHGLGSRVADAIELPAAGSGFYSTHATKFWEPEMGAVNEEA